VLRGETAACRDLLDHRSLETRHEGAQGGVLSADAEDDAGPSGAEPGGVDATRVPQDVTGDVEAQQLDQTGRVQRARRDAEFERIEGLGRKEPAAAAVRLVGSERVGVVEDLAAPMSFGHIAGAVLAGQDILPELAEVPGFGKDAG